MATTNLAHLKGSSIAVLRLWAYGPLIDRSLSSWLIIDFPIAQPNHFVDYAFVRIVSLPLQYLTGILTSAAILYLAEVLNVKCRPLEFFGKNSLTMMATHNPLPVLSFIYNLYKKYVPTLGRYPDDIIILIIVLLAEVPIVLFINRFLPFIVRWPKKKQS